MKKITNRILGICLMLCMVFTITPIQAFASGADNIVQIARAEVGVSGRPNKYTYWTGSIGGSYSYAWCASFVSWCANQAGESKAIPKSVNVRSMANDILNAGGSRVYSPQAGDIVVYRRVRDDYYAHVGIMENGSTSIEGNFGNAVRRGIQPGAYRYLGSSVSNGKIEVIYLRPNYQGSGSPVGRSVQSYFDCDVKISTTKYKRVNLFSNPTDGAPKTYFIQGQTAYSTRGARLSDGSTWYEIQAKNGSSVLTLWLNAASNGVSISNISSNSNSSPDSALSVQSYFDCNVQINTTKGKRADLYRNPIDSSPKTYFSKGQSSHSTRGARLSNGSTWYEIQAMDNGQATALWINAAASGVIITDLSAPAPAAIPAARTAADPGSDFYAYIVNTGLRKYVTNDSNGNVTSRNPYDTASMDSWRQIWHFQRLSNGAYKIASAHDDYCLDVQEFGTSNGTNVRAYLDNGCSAQQWFLYSDNGAYNLRGSCTECYLDVSENSGANGANIQMYQPNGTGAQRFSIEKVNVIRNADVGTNFDACVVNTSRSTFLTNEGNGRTSSSSQRPGNAQWWHFEKNSDGSYKITSLLDGLSLDVYQSETTPGVSIGTYAYHGGKNQQWNIFQFDGSYLIKASCTNHVMEFSGSTVRTGTNTASSGQLFQIWK